MADCNTCLPLETIIQSTVELEDIGEITGNDCLMILTNVTTGAVGPADLSRTYSNIDDFINDFPGTGPVAATTTTPAVPATPLYNAVLIAFSQSPRPVQVKVGYYDPADVTTLTALSECNACKAFVTPELRDDPTQLTIAAWAEAHDMFYGADVNDPLHVDSSDTTSIGYQLTQAGYEYTQWFYHPDMDVQLASAVFAFSIGHNFGNGDNYTQFFADIVGVPTVAITTTELETLTGFSSATGLTANAIHHGNTLVCINGCGGTNVAWGLMASGDFFDNRHYVVSVDERIKAEQCNALRSGLLATVSGYQTLANAVRNILRTDQLNGLVAGDIGNVDSEGLGYQVTIPTPAQAGQALRSNRIAPCVQWQARRDQPVHIACNNGLITQ